MFVNMLVSVTHVPEAETSVLVVKLPVTTNGEHITSVQPIKIKDTDKGSPEAWTDALADALSSTFNEFANSWGPPRDSRRKLFSELAVRLANAELNTK